MDGQAQVNNVWNAGYELQECIGVDRARIASKYLNSLSNFPEKFIPAAMSLLIENKVLIPKELITVKEQPILATTFTAGMVGEKRV